MRNVSPQLAANPWPHRFAVALVCATFPLLWVGGLVTTYKAGMAVPDWPTTYGYNPLLYPISTWIFGPWDLFIEHGHRLLVGPVGVLTIACSILIWHYDPRRWPRYAALAVIVLLVAQAVLGGMRVVLDERVLARLHACVGPLFFVAAACLAAFTSRWWHDAQPRVREGAGRLQGLAVSTAALAYVQLVLGAHVRHLPDGTSQETFRLFVIFHLLMAAVVTVHIVLLNLRVRRQFRDEPLLRRPTLLLGGLIVLQLSLGVATWVVHYNVPAWFSNTFGLGAGYLVEANSLLQAHLTTAHVAGGQLIFMIATMVALRSLRLLRREPVPATIGRQLAGVAL